MPLSEQLLWTGGLLIAAGALCVVLSFASRFIRQPATVLPVIPNVRPQDALPPPMAAPVITQAPSLSTPTPIAAPEASSNGVLLVGVMLLLLTGFFGYRQVRRRSA